MSIHRSLAVIGKLKRHRNVLKKSERLEKMLSDGKPEDEISIFAMPKIRNIMVRAKPKAKKEDAATTTDPAAAGTTPAATGAVKTAPAGKAAAGATATKPDAKGAASDAKAGKK